MITYEGSQIYTAGQMYLDGHNLKEISVALGVSEPTAQKYVHEAGFSIDEKRYHKVTPAGEMVLTEAGQKWATDWTAMQVMFAVLGLEAKHG